MFDGDETGEGRVLSAESKPAGRREGLPMALAPIGIRQIAF